MADPVINAVDIVNKMDASVDSAQVRIRLDQLQLQVSKLTQTVSSFIDKNKADKEINAIVEKISKLQKETNKSVEERVSSLITEHNAKIDSDKAKLIADNKISSSLVANVLKGISETGSSESGLNKSNKGISDFISKKFKDTSSKMSPVIKQIEKETESSNNDIQKNIENLKKALVVLKTGKEKGQELNKIQKSFIDDVEKLLKSDETLYDPADPNRVKKLADKIKTKYYEKSNREKDELEAQIKATIEINKQTWGGLKSLPSTIMGYLGSSGGGESSHTKVNEMLAKKIGEGFNFASKLLSPRMGQEELTENAKKKKEASKGLFDKSSKIGKTISDDIPTLETIEVIPQILSNTEEIRRQIDEIQDEQKSDDMDFKKRQIREEEISSYTNKKLREIDKREEEVADETDEIRENVAYMLTRPYKKSIAKAVIEELEEMNGKKGGGIWDTIKGALGGLLGTLGSFLLKPLWSLLKGVSSFLWKGIKGAASFLWKGIKSVSSFLWKGIKGAASFIWKGVKSVSSFLWKGITKASSFIWNGLKKVSSSVWNTAKSWSSSLWKGTKGIASSLWNTVKGFSSKIAKGLGGLFKGIGGLLKNVGGLASKGLGAAGSLVTKGIGVLGVAGSAYGAYSMLSDKEERDKEARRLSEMSTGERVLETAFDPIQQGKNIAIAGSLGYDIISTKMATSSMRNQEIDRATKSSDKFEDSYFKFKEKVPEETARVMAAQQSFKNMGIGPIQAIAISSDATEEEKKLANEIQRKLNTSLSYASIDATRGTLTPNVDSELGGMKEIPEQWEKLKSLGKSNRSGWVYNNDLINNADQMYSGTFKNRLSILEDYIKSRKTGSSTAIEKTATSINAAIPAIQQTTASSIEKRKEELKEASQELSDKKEEDSGGLINELKESVSEQNINMTSTLVGRLDQILSKLDTIGTPPISTGTPPNFAFSDMRSLSRGV